jgi:hypothetical protein
MVVGYPSASKTVKGGAEPDAIHIRKDDRNMIIREKILPIDAYFLVDFIHGLSLGRIGFVNLLGRIVKGSPSAISSEPQFLALNSNRKNHLAGKTLSEGDVLEGQGPL